MPDAPKPTLLTSGAGVRVAGVATVIAVLWLAVWWATR